MELQQEKEYKEYDAIVVGGGAAGLMAAGTAAAAGHRVVLLEKMEKAGRKIRITGKGRCNLTNMRPREEFLEKVRANPDLLAVAFAEFDNRATCRFFEHIGVKLTVERGERVFPASGKAWDIAQGLVDWCREQGVAMIFGAQVSEILTVCGRVLGVRYRNKRGFERKIEAPNVILATGGASYPATGSTGDGYALAHALGHGIEPVRPSLVPLETSHRLIGRLSGVTLRNIGARLYVDDVQAGEEFGEIAFSERGLEGAVVLRMSRTAVDALIDGKRVKMALDLKPALSDEVLDARIRREREALQPADLFAELLRKLLPHPLVAPMAAELDIDPRSPLEKFTDEQIARVVRVLKHWVFPVSDYRPFEEAVVTAGGVEASGIDPRTMQSRLVRGLYIAGEVLDLDADTGGYNLQIAFSTGRLAGQLKK